MHLPDLTLHRPGSLEEASRLLKQFGTAARVLAGGTDLLVDLQTGRSQASQLVSLVRCEGLRGLRQTPAGLCIGALTTIAELATSPAVGAQWPALHEAASGMAAPQVRNVATVGGNIASAVPCADLPPVLIALRATVGLWSPAGNRTVGLESWFTGPRQTIRRPEELLVEVLVPPAPAGTGAAYARFALRAGNAIAVAAVAASLTLGRDGTIADARIVLGAVAPVPRLVEAAGRTLLGRRPEEALFARAAAEAQAAAEPISDVRGSAEYRRTLVGVLTRRALAGALARVAKERP